MRVSGAGGRHLFICADSRRIEYARHTFGLVLTSPPFFHPVRTESKHGFSPTTDLNEYAKYVAAILANCSTGLKTSGFVCIVKTDVWHRGDLIPVGFRLVEECGRNGLRLRAHWIWRRSAHYSPYSPSFTNIFLLAEHRSPRPQFGGIFSDVGLRRRSSLPTSYTPEVFQLLLELLTEPNDVVLDPFAGIGSVIEASSNTGRWSVGIEVAPTQVRLARKHLAATIPHIVFDASAAGRGKRLSLRS